MEYQVRQGHKARQLMSPKLSLKSSYEGATQMNCRIYCSQEICLAAC